MKNTFIFFVVFICFGCTPKGSDKEQVMVLSGQPIWFPLGNEIYSTEGLATAEEGLLAFKSESRWFKSSPKIVSKKEYEDRLKESPSIDDTQYERGQTVFIHSKLSSPKDLESLSLKNQGASLEFQISNGANENELIFNLILIAKERAIIREVEYRYTNLLPFLFAFYLDGKAITPKLEKHGGLGGLKLFKILVPLNQKKEWHLRVDKKSIDKLVGQEGKELEIVVSFSERQHQRISKYSFEDLYTLNGLIPNIILRSNVNKLKRTAEGWAKGK